MAQYYPYSHQSFGLQAHHPARSRRGPRFHGNGGHGVNSNQSSKQPKHGRAARENAEAAQLLAFRKDFEAARSFDLEDDEMFCPWHLLTEDDLHSIHSTSSDRSSSSSGSPTSSPLQHQLQPNPSMTLPQFQQAAAAQIKLHQPLAQRSRNAIPIVDPNNRTESPPDSVSPARHLQKGFSSRRW